VTVHAETDADYVPVAYVAAGRFGAVAAALAVLHAGGLVSAGQAGTVRRSGIVTPPDDGFERCIWGAIHGFVSPGALMARPAVDRAFNDLRRRCRRLGLIRPLLPVQARTPARTKLGREFVDAARRDCPWPPSPEHAGASLAGRVGMPVALYGGEALRALMPAFARDSGLLDHASADGLDWIDPVGGPGEGVYW
jgi:hypothetical protein